ncbi:hypothetical protein Tco_1179004 [Tanacetum coccineum]
MKNGAWTPMHFARFSAVRQYENHRLFSKENGLDPRDLVSRTEFVRLLMESGTVDPFEFTQNFIKKQTEEARKNNKRKSHDYKGKGKEIEELDNDVDHLPISRVFAYCDKLEKEEKDKQKQKKQKANLQEKERRRRRNNREE